MAKPLYVIQQRSQWPVWTGDPSSRGSEVITPLAFGGTTKQDSVEYAKEIAEENGHYAVVIEDSDGDVQRVWWNPGLTRLTVEYNHDRDQWELWTPGERRYGSSRQSDVVEVGKDVQEDHGYKFLKIEKKDGSIYWKRQHPLYRRHG